MVTPMLPRPTATSAGALVMHGQLAALNAHHEVTLATFAGPDPAERDALDRLGASGIDVHAVWRRAPSGARRWVRRWRLGRQWLRGRQPLRTLEFLEPAMQRLLDRLLDEKRFHLVQVEDNAMAAYRYRPGVPIVLTDHEVRTTASAGPEDGQAANGMRWALREADRRLWRRYQPAAWRRFDRIQVFTSRDAAAARAMAPEIAGRVRVNPFGVELPPDIDPTSEQSDAVVFVGGFGHLPNVDAALWLGNEIMPLLRARRPGVRLTLVGSQPPASVRALAGEDTVVTGRVPAVEPHLLRAAVVLAPLRTGGGMRLKVLQAMAHGKALVTTPLGAAGLAVGLCPPPLAIGRDAAEIAEAAAELLATDSARRALGRRARAFVAEHHSWRAYQLRLEVLYRELLSEHRHHHDHRSTPSPGRHNPNVLGGAHPHLRHDHQIT